MKDLFLSKIDSPSMVLTKVCRLCECKDGPFLNIFGSGMGLPSKIEELLPIYINESDDLPHKICFRCSAKVTDLHEFLQKCLKTQESLCSKLGKECNIKKSKNKARSEWEAKLNKNRISNEQYCDEVVKKALAAVTKNPMVLLTENDIPLQLRIKTPPKMVPPLFTIQKPKIELHKVDNKYFPGVRKCEDGTYLIVKLSEKDIADKQKEKISPPKDTDTIPDYVKVLNVDGVGSIYNCDRCSNIFKDKKKIFNHNCSTKLSLSGNTNSVSGVNSPKTKASETNSSFQLGINSGVDSRKTKITEAGNEMLCDLLSKKHKPNHNFSSPMNSQVTIDLSEDYPETNYPPIKMFNQNFSFPSNCYLVPIGNNSFSLQSNVPLPINQNYNLNPPEVTPNVSIISKAPVTAMTYSLDPYDLNIFPKDTFPKPIKKHPGPKRKEQKNITNLPVTPTTSNPYPVGLLYRNSNDQAAPTALNEEITADKSTETISEKPSEKKTSKSKRGKRKESTKYTILPPKTPGKIVISTVSSKANLYEKFQEEDKKIHKKLKEDRKQLKNTDNMDSAKNNDDHFFTYVNLDPMEQTSSDFVLSTRHALLQEPQISTTLPKMKRDSGKKGKKVHAEKPKKDEGNTKFACPICDLEFTRTNKLVNHVKTHYEGFEADDNWDKK